MYQKVIFGREAKTDGGVILGRERGGFDGRIVFEDYTGKQYVATYGILDENGELHTYCTCTVTCGSNCFNANSPACRYNRKYAHSAGYYVFIA